VVQEPISGLGRFRARYLDHTKLDTHTHARTHARRRGRYLQHTANRIRNRDCKSYEAADLRFNPHGHWGRPNVPLFYLK